MSWDRRKPLSFRDLRKALRRTLIPNSILRSIRWQLVANVSITGIFALAILAALYFMRDMVVPVILAWVVAQGWDGMLAQSQVV